MPDSEVDDIPGIVSLSMYNKKYETDKWMEIISSSDNEILNYSIYYSLIHYSNDSVLTSMLKFAQGNDGGIPEELKQSLAFLGTDLAVKTLIEVIKTHGYPKYRFGVGELSYEKNPLWSDFLCDYYTQVRFPMRILFGLGAPTGFSIKQRLQEWNKVNLDIESMDTCSFWF